MMIYMIWPKLILQSSYDDNFENHVFDSDLILIDISSDETIFIDGYNFETFRFVT